MLRCEAIQIMQYMVLEMSTFSVLLNNLPSVISLLDIAQARTYLK